MKIKSFSFSLEANFFWEWYLLVAMINKVFFGINVEEIYFMCFLKSWSGWSRWKEVRTHFVFRSHIKVISREYQDRSHLTKSNELKISKLIVNIVIHVASKFDMIQVHMWVVEVWKLVGDRNIHWINFKINVANGAIQKENKGMSLEVVEHKYIFKKFIQKYDMQSCI